MELSYEIFLLLLKKLLSNQYAKRTTEYATQRTQQQLHNFDSQ